ncbi:hypothetical protein LEP1GSC125_1157 [Leptospira mayottensis 200901122]|uniref:Uncharacterized protein n=1 Tax=Leptospira mayottensis 200901122 TaxID=1193010 RepID=A0AA87MPA4_9LEPT|nr:hypothetical protein LEP1GSC125_1157 [Leptospira mayottensis 200901122]
MRSHFIINDFAIMVSFQIGDCGVPTFFTFTDLFPTQENR